MTDQNSQQDETNRQGIYARGVKRVLDFTFALILLIVLSPIILISMLAIVIDSKGSPIFKQKRVGWRGQVFSVYKLRTMRVEQELNGKPLRDRDRVTKVGRFLRKSSIDELPQFLNIVRGEMSFIGPRPLPLSYYPYYSEAEMGRHDVRPGISGLAQIHGRSDLAWERRFEYDIYYAQHLTFKLDWTIFKETLRAVFSGRNTSTIRPKKLVSFNKHRNFQKVRPDIEG